MEKREENEYDIRRWDDDDDDTFSLLRGGGTPQSWLGTGIRLFMSVTQKQQKSRRGCVEKNGNSFLKIGQGLLLLIRLVANFFAL